jgi:hypothetical protein
LVSALLALMAWSQVTSIRQEAQTWDEGIHLSAGLSHWKTGDYRMDPQHPPLGRLLCALPLLFMNVRLPLEYPSWKQRDEIEFGAQFLYANNLTADQILFPARCVTIAMTLLLGLAIAIWTRRHGGVMAGLTATALFALDPNIIAHGRYVTTDLIVALFTFLACVLWGAALAKRSLGLTIAAGLALGLALGSKFSALFLIPVFIILGVLRWPGWKAFAIVVLSAYGVLLMLYFPELSAHSPLFAPSFDAGLQRVFEHNANGHDAYLLGRISDQGWWYYFPVAFLVKAPLVLIGLNLFSVAVLVLKRRRLSFELAMLAIPAAIYWLACMSSRVDLGIRHLLPAYVLMIPLASIVAARFLPKWTLVLLLCALAVESFSVYPHYLAFFNWASGGPGNGPRYLLDSNIDWGQDTKKLKRWLDARGFHEACRVYFGVAFLGYYGIREIELPSNDQLKARSDLDCVAAASVTPLYGLYVKNDAYRWLRGMTPVAKVGYSIYVYDLRKNKSPPL